MTALSGTDWLDPAVDPTADGPHVTTDTPEFDAPPMGGERPPEVQERTRKQRRDAGEML